MQQWWAARAGGLLPPISAGVSTPPCTMHTLCAHTSSAWDLCYLDRSAIAHNMDKITNIMGVCYIAEQTHSGHFLDALG